MVYEQEEVVSAAEQQHVVTPGELSRDFDAERQARTRRRTLTFTVGGETFRMKPFVTPEDMDSFRQPEGAEKPKDPMEVYDSYVKRMVLEEDAPKWDIVRKEADPPLNLQDVEDVVFFLVEAAAGRPTERPSSSGRGPSASTGTSRDRSRLQTT